MRVPATVGAVYVGSMASRTTRTAESIENQASPTPGRQQGVAVDGHVPDLMIGLMDKTRRAHRVGKRANAGDVATYRSSNHALQAAECITTLLLVCSDGAGVGLRAELETPVWFSDDGVAEFRSGWVSEEKIGKPMVDGAQVSVVRACVEPKPHLTVRLAPTHPPDWSLDAPTRSFDEADSWPGLRLALFPLPASPSKLTAMLPLGRTNRHSSPHGHALALCFLGAKGMQ